MSDMPRSEYPRPQFRRDRWLCLNGTWQFETDPGDTGLERGLTGRELAGEITVPFCPESELSGVGCVDFMNAVWYRRTVTIPPDWQGDDLTVLLNFQAVDYEATVWVNGREVGRHRGGFTPFTCDIGGVVKPGEQVTIVVRALDLPAYHPPCGKQTMDRFANWGCHYTRTTGIWQTVWMEPAGRTRMQRPRITPDVAGRRFLVEVPILRPRAGLTLRATLRDQAGDVARAESETAMGFTPQVELSIPEDRVRLWQPGQGALYDIELQLLDENGREIDRATSYAGLRSVSIDGLRMLINGRSVFQRLVLDQGYYPDGIMTAPSDEALQRDIELSMAAGFNGARLHQKVFEERFLYHADRMGYLVWGEFGDWGCWPDDRPEKPVAHQSMVATVSQWCEVLRRDYSHPSIIGWCPLNETRKHRGTRMTTLDDLTTAMFHATKAADATRPVLDASGYGHRVAEADVYDCHDYDQDPASLRERHAGTADGEVYVNKGDVSTWSIAYNGQPYFVSEMGGIKWSPKQGAENTAESWGYGDAPRSEQEFLERFEGLISALLETPGMFGYCYTQLTDVFQEQNGVYGFDRSVKFEPSKLAAIQQKPAAIETD